MRRQKRHQGQTLAANTLTAAGYILVFTTVPAALLTPAQVLVLYRMRWQIEIVFKRSKSALQLAEIRMKSDYGCYAVLLAKCLLLLLVERIAPGDRAFFPPQWGFPERLSCYRFFQELFATVQQIILGAWRLTTWLNYPTSGLMKFFSERPRKKRTALPDQITRFLKKLRAVTQN